MRRKIVKIHEHLRYDCSRYTLSSNLLRDKLSLQLGSTGTWMVYLIETLFERIHQLKKSCKSISPPSSFSSKFFIAQPHLLESLLTTFYPSN